MANDDVNNLRADISELKKLLDQSTRDKVKSVLSIELRRFETKLADIMDKEAKQNESKPLPSNKSTTKATSRAYDVNVKNYSWDQSDKYVKIYITGLNGVNDVPKDAFELHVGDSSLMFKILELQGNKNMIFELKETPYKISKESSSFKVKTDMVVIMLAKAESGVKWSHLKKSDKDAAEKPKFTPSKPDEADPSAGLMTMMKQMYDEGDDEMKRTIAKAWTESRDKQSNEIDKLGV